MSSNLVSNHWYVCDSVVNRTTRKKIKGLHKELDWVGAKVGPKKDSNDKDSRVDDKGRVRKLSLTLLLNEGYEGGHFEFTRYGNECIKVVRPEFSKAGSIIVFPSHLEHRVTEVTRGVRHSLVAWFMGPPFK